MRKDKANIYVLGRKNCFKRSRKELSKYGKVTRISGETLQKTRLRSLSLKMKNKIWLGIHKTWSRFIICFK